MAPPRAERLGATTTAAAATAKCGCVGHRQAPQQCPPSLPRMRLGHPQPTTMRQGLVGSGDTSVVVSSEGLAAQHRHSRGGIGGSVAPVSATQRRLHCGRSQPVTAVTAHAHHAHVMRSRRRPAAAAAWRMAVLARHLHTAPPAAPPAVRRWSAAPEPTHNELSRPGPSPQAQSAPPHSTARTTDTATASGRSRWYSRRVLCTVVAYRVVDACTYAR